MYFEKTIGSEKFSVCYDKAIREDGSLLFPEKLSKEFLDSQRKTQGSYIFAHQYQNEIIPAEDQDFKREWIKYYTDLPKRKTTVAMIDPAISLDQEACYTALVVVDTDEDNQRYVKLARRLKITATQTVDLIFKVQEIFKPQVFGIESVAYQQALLQFTAREARKRNVNVPLFAVKRAPDKSKPVRIRSLVPYFEWDRVRLKPGLVELEDELNKFPRGTSVDLLDALSDAMDLSYPPQKERVSNVRPHPNHPDFERWYRNHLAKIRSKES